MQDKVDKFFVGLLVFIPISLIFYYLTNSPIITFITAVISLAALARFLGRATENIAAYSTPKVSGLLNATFGNFIELTVLLFAIEAGIFELVRAGIVGSILVNLLFLIGISIFIGGIKFKEQRFNAISAGISCTMMIIAVLGLIMPTVYTFTTGSDPHSLSTSVSIILAIIYISGLFFSLYTHRYLFYTEDMLLTKFEGRWSKKNSIIALFIASTFITLESSILVNTITSVSLSWGLSYTFIGVVIVGVLSNVAEITAAITMALKNRINISLEIGASSANQVALFVVPILVLASTFMSHQFTLVFSLFEIVSLLMTTLIINYLITDGHVNWLAGMQLMAVFFIIAIAFYYI